MQHDPAGSLLQEEAAHNKATKDRSGLICALRL